MPFYATNPEDGVRIAYDVTGSGEPLLLVHGSALSKAIWRGFGYTQALRNRYRVITVDLRGHGHSDKPHEPAAYAMDRVVADSLAVIEAAGQPEETAAAGRPADSAVHYLGYSFGARIGFALATLHPGRLRSFVSVAGTYRTHPGTIAELFFPDFERAMETARMPGFVAGWEQRLGRPLDPDTRRAFLANDSQALLAYFRATDVQGGVPPESLGGVRVPTLLLAGSADAGRLEDSRLAAALIPGARLVELPGRNHGSTLTPAAEVLAAVEPFLARHSGGAATGVAAASPE
ncbi:alpha/beta hydrolase [Paenarthrobacter sp. Z7-10]|uniref:alpha/beta fold hydrolase n=1 Tax=Paenarthrobacter sp. Z7-10 TaxID=2787635 RepID=UPI0022A9005F|nr:alpha/beta hydrolase [Paenarthrobacter sp. Z7-10]MCZ2403571.1 alpha/beta hydrolase [Paenarthrobacter sp. Z7-10]